MLFPSETIWHDSDMTDYSNNSLFNWRRNPTAHNVYINIITYKMEENTAQRTEALKKVIPGDIWYYEGHIGIVFNTTSGNNGDENGIMLIESVYNTKNGIRFGGVVNYRSLEDITNLGNAWTIGRLK
jgi:hypothetical protein